MRKIVLSIVLALVLVLVLVLPATAAPRIHNESTYLDAGFTMWPGSGVPHKYGGYLDLYFPFDRDMNLYVWFKGFYEGDVALIEGIGEIGVQIGFNPYLAIFCGAIYGFNSDLYLGVDPEVGLLARLPLGEYVEVYAKGSASYYFDPVEMGWDDLNLHYGLYVVVHTKGILSFNIGSEGYWVPTKMLTIPSIQAGVGFKF